MNEKEFFKIRLYFTAAVAIAIWALLAWNHYHGGVPSHHLLANKDLPAISNWWGGLLLPLLTWWLLYRMQKRIFGHRGEASNVRKSLHHALYRFSGALLFGVVLSAFFTSGNPEICSYMVLGLFPLALFIPIYRAECLLGFILGMTYTFGAVLPTLFGIIFSVIGLVLYRYIRAGVLYVGTKAGLMVPARK